jgi:hypothetical protein
MAAVRVSTTLCEWCGRSFTPTNRRGPRPRYCRASHRQRAYELRRLARELDAKDFTITEVAPAQGDWWPSWPTGIFSLDEITLGRRVTEAFGER